MSETTCTYTDLTAQFHGQPTLPLLHHGCDATMTIYLPDWAPPAVVARLVQQCYQDHHARRVDIVRVTQCPTARLFGDWAEHMPQEPPDAQ